MRKQESYKDFVDRKLSYLCPSGIGADKRKAFPVGLFDHQEALINWSLRRGRAAIFADTGLGKTRMQVVWANVVEQHIKKPVLILAPLAVGQQTIAEAEELGIVVSLCKDQSDVRSGIAISNYERLHRFDSRKFGAIVLDESSCIKHHDSKTLKRLLEFSRGIDYKLCATATPAPNDWVELGTHAEFLGVCSRQEMLSEFFVHDGGETSVWRLKKHARQDFWRWVCSWGSLVTKPSDLGFDDGLYMLPSLHVHEHRVGGEVYRKGSLFPFQASTLMERRQARRDSIETRVEACADRVNSDKNSWIVWCELNAEGEYLHRAIKDSVEIRGENTLEEKEQRLVDFSTGKTRVLITKPSIAGFGLNWQHCSNIAFVGVSDSYESYYQAVRRCWRFGQKRDVNVHLFTSVAEQAILANLKAKERAAKDMSSLLSEETRYAVLSEVRGLTRESNHYNAGKQISIPPFLLRGRKKNEVH